MAKASLPLGDELCSMPTLRSLEMTCWAVLSLLLIREGTSPLLIWPPVKTACTILWVPGGSCFVPSLRRQYSLTREIKLGSSKDCS
jgi:hypothetical protein